MILSAPPTRTATNVVELNEENISRVRWGVRLAKERALLGTGAELFDELPHALPPGADDEDDYPMLYLNGESEQLGPLLAYTMKYYPASRIRTINCGDRGVGNTLTQFTVIARTHGLADAFRQHSVVTIITSAYHVPRVTYTAERWLDGICSWVVAAVPLQGDIHFPITLEHIKAELDRVAKYIPKGDLARP